MCTRHPGTQIRHLRSLVAILLLAALLFGCAGKPSAAPKAAPAPAPTASPTPSATPGSPATPKAAPAPAAAPPPGNATTAERAPSTPSTGAPPMPSMGYYPPYPQPPYPQPPYPSDTTYRDYGVNPAVAAAQQPTSTFGVDVDTASFTIARDYLDRGTLPPPEAVRAEEFINYFPQEYPAPVNQGVTAYVEWALNPFRPAYQLVQVSLKAREVPKAQRKPLVLTFVIDVSGSMAQDGRLELVKRSLQLLLDQLDPRDRIGIVAFTTHARVVAETTGNKARIRAAIDSLSPQESTNVNEGMTLGYAMASRNYNSEANNRVILASDGVANESLTTPDAILRQVADYRAKNIYLTTIGVGMGNYNDVLLEQLADKGNGNYYYVNSDAEGRRVFVENLTGTLETVAKDVKVQVSFDAARVITWRLVGYENRVMANQDFRNDRVDSGEMGAGSAVTALYELQLYPEARGIIGNVAVRYKEPASGETMELSLPITPYQPAAGATRVHWTAAVAEFAGRLKGSPWAAETSLTTIRNVAKQAAAALDETEPRRQFLTMIDQAMQLTR